MDAEALFRRYQELQQYVGWTDADADRVHAVAGLLASGLPALIDDFYAEIDRHPDARKVITGGRPQIERLKGTLLNWLRELLSSEYDRAYVARRWRVGSRHVEIGLDQVYTNAALSRLRRGLLRLITERWTPDRGDQGPTRQSLNVLIDLDLAMIEDAYQAEYIARQQRTERLAAIGQVAGGIAHELRNPLNVVKTSVYFLLNARNPSSAKTAEHLHRIERHVVVADSVITALSNFARMPLPNLRPVPLGPALREALEINPLPESVHVTIDCSDSLPAALADPDQLRIVLGNLIRNAREAMSQGGRLTLTVRAAGDGLDVAVADTGIGIPAESLVKVMEPLYSTKARGLGLGLAIVRSILDKNTGRLSVASEPGRGTTFTVRLAAAPPETVAP